MAIQITQSYSIRLVLFIKNVKNEKKIVAFKKSVQCKNVYIFGLQSWLQFSKILLNFETQNRRFSSVTILATPLVSR
jgi:hypothetical protein